MRCDIDLGSNHTLQFTAWAPDRALNSQYDGFPDVDKDGAILYHSTPEGVPHVGAITFDSPSARQRNDKGPFWRVISFEPLTVEPSIQCKCGDHGFIREGRWVSA